MRKPFAAAAAAAATAVLVLSAAGAGAADIPARAPAYKAPAFVAPVFSWTGFYVGANLGYGWSDASGSIGVTGAGTGPLSGDADGILGGVQAGYNWQTGPWVFGIEADIQATGAEGPVTGSPGAATIAATYRQPWFGTIRGRLGYAFDRTMVYVTGGGLYGEGELEGTITTTGAFKSSEIGWTYTVGGGVEHMFMPNWSAKLEYLYAGTPDRFPTPPNTVGLTGSADSHIVRAGINYHF